MVTAQTPPVIAMDESVVIEQAAGPLFLHVRVLVGMIIGLGLTHMLRGIARIIEYPGHRRVYWVHAVWVVSVFLYLLHWWWWEFRLSELTHWTFNRYLYVVLYALLLYLLCALLLPESIDNYRDYRDYFYSRRKWLFGLLALMYVVDFGDTWLKGSAYFHEFGYEYLLRNAAYVIASLAAVATINSRYHATFAVFGLIFQVWWIAKMFETLY